MSESSKYPFTPKTLEEGQGYELLDFEHGRVAWLSFSQCPQKAIPGFAPSPGHFVEWKLFQKPCSSGQRLVIAQGETAPLAGYGTARARAVLDILAFSAAIFPSGISSQLVVAALARARRAANCSGFRPLR